MTGVATAGPGRHRACRVAGPILPAVLVAVCTALTVVPSASAKTIRLKWREQVVVAGEPMMRLHVDALTVAGGRWAVRLSFTNTSPRRLTLFRDQFALALYGPGARDACRFRQLKATTFSPARPTRLRPGGTWRGVFGGYAVLPARGAIRVVVGSFSGGPPTFRRFGWITDHLFDLALRRPRLAVAPPCT